MSSLWNRLEEISDNRRASSAARIGTEVLLRNFNCRLQIEEDAFDPGIQLNDASEQFPLPTSDVDNVKIFPRSRRP